MSSASGETLVDGLTVQGMNLYVEAGPVDEILRLQAQLADIAKRCRAVLDATSAEQRSMTTEERAAFDADRAEIGRIKKRIADLEAIEALEGELAASEARVAVKAAPGTSVGEDLGRSQTGWRDFRDFLTAVVRAEVGHGVDRRLVFEDLREGRAAALGLGLDAGEIGGFLVPPQFSSEIFRVAFEMGAILSRVTRSTLVGTDTIEIPGVDETSRATGSRMGGVRGYWIDEGAAPTASKPKLRMIEFKTRGLGCLGYVTDKLLRQAQVTQQLLTEGFSSELVFLAEDAIVNGDGVGKPLGFLNETALISVAKETGQAAATIVHANLSKMATRMFLGGRGNAVWLANQDCEPELDNLFVPAGTAGLAPRVITYTEDGQYRIKGRPVIFVEYCQTLGTVGDLIYVDLSQYRLVDEGSPEAASSMHLKFDSFQTAFRAIYQLDGKLMWRSAITPFNGTSTVSPAIALATRA